MNCIIIITFCVFSVPTSGLYFSLNGVIYNPGSSIDLADIGEQPSDRSDAGSTLVCHTGNVNTQCCRFGDSLSGMSMGDWLDPSNNTVPAPSALGGATNVFTRYHYFLRVILATVGGTPSGPLGVYTCVVPDMNGVDVSATVTVTGTVICSRTSIIIYNSLKV